MCNTTDEYPKGYVSVNSRDGLAMYSINRKCWNCSIDSKSVLLGLTF
jgi:hypothetical protein